MNVLRVFAMLGLACALPGMVCAQSLKSAIVGTWALTAVVDQYEGGEKVNNWGTAKGSLAFDAAGRFSQIIVGDVQPALKSPDPRKPDAPVVAYYGTYRVDEATKTVSLNLDAASWSPRAGTSQSVVVDLKGDVMSIVGSPRKDQRGTFRPRLELKRAASM